jgi:hypothetical protein
MFAFCLEDLQIIQRHNRGMAITIIGLGLYRVQPVNDSSKSIARRTIETGLIIAA